MRIFSSLVDFIFRRRNRALRQVAALCYRGSGADLEFLLVTSRGRGNWILPKGWPEADMADPDTAALEAYEEAGVRGQLDRVTLGSIDYDKTQKNRDPLACCADVYALKVDTVLDTYPEADERERAWFTREEAIENAAFQQLKTLLKTFTPPRA